MKNEMKRTARVTVEELAERLKSETEGIDKKVDDAHFRQSGMRELRIMCRSNLSDPEDLDCVEELAHMHGFLADGEEMQRHEPGEKEAV